MGTMLIRRPIGLLSSLIHTPRPFGAQSEAKDWWHLYVILSVHTFQPVA